VKVHLALDQVQRSEAELVERLRLLAEHHASDHDVYHLGHLLAVQESHHVDQLAPFLATYDARRIEVDDEAKPGLADTLREKASTLLGRSEPAGLLLARELREVYLVAQQAEIDWVVLDQTVKAVRDGDLLQLVEHCHEETEAAAKWLRTRIKVSSAQVYATG
jgi:hypothetical protein